MTTMPPPRRLLVVLLAITAVTLAACADEPQPEPTAPGAQGVTATDAPGRYSLPESEAAGYETAYLAAVQLPTDEEDGYILIRNNWDQRADLGGWAIRGRNNRRFPIPPSSFVEPNGELRVHLGSGESDVDDLYLDVGKKILDWDRLTLVDAAGGRVARFVYGR